MFAASTRAAGQGLIGEAERSAILAGRKDKEDRSIAERLSGAMYRWFQGGVAGQDGPAAVSGRQTTAFSRTAKKNPRQRGCQRRFRVAQYSLGKWITLLAKYSVISSSGKSVCSISLVNTMLPLPSSHSRAWRVFRWMKSHCTLPTT